MLPRRRALAEFFRPLLSAQVWRSEQAFCCLQQVLRRALPSLTLSFKGQTVHLYIGFAPGGTYDYFGRLVTRHIGRHLPGNPTVIAEQMPGAGSFTAANYLYARAPRTAPRSASSARP